MINTVKKKLEGQLKAAKAVNKYANVIAKPCMDALICFCEQDEEFLRAVNDGDLVECMEKITEKIGSSISDIEVYRRAAEFYFKGAKVSFEMKIQVNPYDNRTAEPGELSSYAERFAPHPSTPQVLTPSPEGEGYSKGKPLGGFKRLSLDDLIGG